VNSPQPVDVAGLREDGYTGSTDVLRKAEAMLAILEHLRGLAERVIDKHDVEMAMGVVREVVRLTGRGA
jgi:hypothetical protein